MKLGSSIQQPQFELESLEPRIMLSSEGAAAVSDSAHQIVQQMFDEQDVPELKKSDLSLQASAPCITSVFENDEEKVEANDSETTVEGNIMASANLKALKGEGFSGKDSFLKSVVIKPLDILDGSKTIYGNVS